MHFLEINLTHHYQSSYRPNHITDICIIYIVAIHSTYEFDNIEHDILGVKLRNR